ncbi:hypothetical protein PILCRDRAFT_686593 [Piloderma croceum F 1598]|uniref:Uncharacterized protein n=1 Tax=Piloderma croceum (strain F 1598) TaxID=765440 RepID=A0A0C3F4Q6_PILCF|nr:hypothetical protein PILCRDRAFT_686593 [Piloderma croceum F 1598]
MNEADHEDLKMPLKTLPSDHTSQQPLTRDWLIIIPWWPRDLVPSQSLQFSTTSPSQNRANAGLWMRTHLIIVKSIKNTGSMPGEKEVVGHVIATLG